MATSAELAQALTRARGRADASDVALVVDLLALFPVPILDRFREDGTGIVVCRDSVTDYLTKLQGVQPRGWPPGSTWDSVPGLFYPEKNEVVLAVVGHGTSAGPHIPRPQEGQGSVNIMLHESAHGVDMGGGTPFMSASQAFVAARNADWDKLTAYERQPSPAGEEETFAESAARFYVGQDQVFSHLHEYWASISNELDKQAEIFARLPTEQRLPLQEAAPDETIGTASMSADGTLTLQLRATDQGMRADAVRVYRSDQPAYDLILRHVGGLQPYAWKHVSPFPPVP